MDVYQYNLISKVKKLFCIHFFCQGIVALVTGGASGLGRATVERIVRNGGKVVLCDLPNSHGSQVAAGMSESVVFAPTDVSLWKLDGCNEF